MYHDHPQFRPPPADAVLWRYMDFTKFVSLLETSALYFCRPDLLGDPFEGSISPATPPLVAGEFEAGSQITQHTVDVRQVTRLARVNCWHMGEFESEAMWRLYTRERDEVAIKTVFARFREALVGEEDVNVSRVWYRDYRTDSIPFGNAMFPLFHKRISFQHEQEVRALYMVNSEDDGSDDAIGGYFQVDLPKLVEEVVVAPFAENWFAGLVRSLAQRYGIGNQVRPSTLSDDPTFTLSFLTPQN